MDLTVDKTTLIGLGHASLADAFQCGREAAQMAKSQIPGGDLDLVLVLGPGNVHFKDFIEGVRLVTGEETLVGLPVAHTYSSERSSTDACFVLILKSKSMRFHFASTSVTPSEIPRGTTALVSAFRRARGNAFQNYVSQGLFLFENLVPNQNLALSRQIGADLGLGKWMVGASTLTKHSNPLICQNAAIRSGLIGIECLSQRPWGIGTVGLGSFSNHPNVYQEAVKSAVRDALAQLREHSPVFGLVFFDFKNGAELIPHLLDGATALLPNVQILGFPTQHHFARRINRSVKTEPESVVAILVPA